MLVILITIRDSKILKKSLVESTTRLKTQGISTFIHACKKTSITIDGKIHLLAAKQTVFINSVTTIDIQHPEHIQCLQLDSVNCEISVFLKLSKSQDSLFHRLWSSLVKEQLDPDLGISLNYLAYQLLHEYSANISYNSTKKLNPPILYALRYIRKNYSDINLSLPIISRHINYHPNYFCKEFKYIVGVTPMKYLQQIRVLKALELLQMSTLSTENISQKVGISTPTYLSQLVKQKTGMSPMKYRMLTVT
ncbi:helix-turn-helix transcriptional regulator [Paenibacillus glacialis]|uniref:HTH araC/xylS-type domain-containing protein n=1 Tax=Paenibacillus glacialis TaxID=494026 RepID=A0A168D112_9BACL|nr:AraC family transcriptional regulator [Paenibacillus glacialis]OAB33784.1 hypothetical protein PGLA_22905 [Paenibacillus glacialis]